MSTSLRGVNVAGAEWQYDPSYQPVEGQNYTWVTHRDIDYLASRGVAFIRLLFSWELLQPSLDVGFAASYLASMSDRVRYATGKGMIVMIEPHGGDASGFARYKGKEIGSVEVPNSAFAGLWQRLAQSFKDNPNVVFGLMNEPHDMSTLQWFAAAQAAIDAIRGTGAANLVMVPGNGFSAPASWNDTWYDTAPDQVSNATGWETLGDALGKLVVSVHTYFDADGGGGATDIASLDIIAQRMQPVVDWARARNLKVHLSEFGASASEPGAPEAVANAIAYLDANKDVVIGWSWWAYGPPDWWGGYQFTLCPTDDYTVDDPKMAWLQPHFAGPPEGVPSVRPAPARVPAPADALTTWTKTAGPGEYPGVNAGEYSLQVAAYTTYGADDSFCVDLVLSNPSDRIDVDWQEMTVDVGGHQIGDTWNCTVSGSTGIVTFEPVDGARTVQALNRTSVGCCLRRSSVPEQAGVQVLVTGLAW